MAYKAEGKIPPYFGPSYLLHGAHILSARDWKGT